MNDTKMGMNFSADYTPPKQDSVLGVGISQVYYVKYTNPVYGGDFVEEIHNIVPDAALNEQLNIIYGSSAKWTNLYVGLVLSGTNTYAAGDTMASHAGWSETVPYSEANRPSASFGAAASKIISNTSSPATFSITGSADIAGCFISTNNTKSGGTGILVGVGGFSNGSRAVAASGTLTVTVSATASSV
jgi:hypothetical protein